MIKLHSERMLRNRYCFKCGAQISYYGHNMESLGDPNATMCDRDGVRSWVALNAGCLDVGKAGGDVTAWIHSCDGKITELTGNPDIDFKLVRQPNGESEESAPSPAVVPGSVVSSETAYANGHANGHAATATLAPPAVDPKVVEALGPFAAMLAPAIAPLLATKVDAEQVTAIIQAELAGRGALPTRIEMVHPNGEIKPVEGLTHMCLPKIIRYLNMPRRKHVFMVGPAGTGKTHMGIQAAEALGLDLYPVQVGPTMTEAKMLGFVTANGQPADELVHQWATKGGLLLIDEVDNGSPAVLNVLNMALGNGIIVFPGGRIVKLHPDCRVLIGGNTYGTGPDATYVGRQHLDGAFKNRFIVVDVPEDEALERALCDMSGLEGYRIARALEYVRHLRKNARSHNIPVVIGVRNSINLCDVLADGGIPLEDAINDCIRQGMPDKLWNVVTASAPTFS